MKRILVYSHDTYGLGNIRRMLALVEHLTTYQDDASALILSGSPMLQAFRLGPRIDYIKLPCLLRGEDGHYAPKFLDIPYEKLLRLRADLILNTLLDLEPDLVLVDKKPLGVQNELAPALQVLRRSSKRPKLALILREILDSPQRTRAVWEKNRYHNAIKELYDKVLVLGPKEVFDTAKEYEFPQSTVEKLHYCGYLGKRQSLRPVSEIRRELGLATQRLIVVTAGGGQDGFNLLNNVCQAFPADNEQFHFLMCLVRKWRPNNAHCYDQQANALSHLSILDFTQDLMSYMNAAELVVAMAGYNTVTEILTLNKPAVLIPRTEPAQEQWIRATRLERLGLFKTLHPDQVSPTALRQLILGSLGDTARRNTHARPVSLNALDEIVEQLEGLFGADTTGGWERLLLDQHGDPIPPENEDDSGYFAALRR